MSPDPKSNGSAPQLPPMSIAERELWMLSHRAPEGMLMIHTSEIQQVQRHLMAMTMERELLVKALGKLRKNEESPLLTVKRILEQLRARKQSSG